jgi:hypothetical protein
MATAAAVKPLESRSHNVARPTIAGPDKTAASSAAAAAPSIAAMTESQKKEEERRQRHAERFDQAVPQLVYEQVRCERWVPSIDRSAALHWQAAPPNQSLVFCSCSLAPALRENAYNYSICTAAIHAVPRRRAFLVLLLVAAAVSLLGSQPSFVCAHSPHPTPPHHTHPPAHPLKTTDMNTKPHSSGNNSNISSNNNNAAQTHTHTHAHTHAYTQMVSESGRAVTKTYRRGKLLGKGGFARCFVFTDLDTNHDYAGKVVQKSSLTRTRAREKLMAEIKIHRSLNHPHVRTESGVVVFDVGVVFVVVVVVVAVIVVVVVAVVVVVVVVAIAVVVSLPLSSAKLSRRTKLLVVARE